MQWRMRGNNLEAKMLKLIPKVLVKFYVFCLLSFMFKFLEVNFVCFRLWFRAFWMISGVSYEFRGTRWVQGYVLWWCTIKILSLTSTSILYSATKLVFLMDMVVVERIEYQNFSSTIQGSIPAKYIVEFVCFLLFYSHKSVYIYCLHIN
jgi:hypothetical protein